LLVKQPPITRRGVVPELNDKPPVLPDHLREFDDIDTTRTMIYDNALGALNRRFPISDGKFRLELHQPRYTGAKDFSLQQQKRAIMTNRTLTTPVKATWKLIDEESGGTLDEREDVIMRVPYYTPRGTFIHNGSEYTVVNQSKLKPGVYTRTKKSGQLEAHFNTAQGTGKQFRIWMEPATGVFRVAIQQANIPAYSFLKSMGVKDEQLKKAWGSDLLATNIQAVKPRDLTTLYTRFSGYDFNPDATDKEKEEYLNTSLAKYGLNSKVVARTLGLENVETLSPEVAVRATQKLINISRGDEEEDDRDAPEHSKVSSVEDFVRDRIDLDAGKTARQLLWKIRRDKNLNKIGRGALDPYMTSLILGSGLAAPLEETNPLQILDQQHRITKLGEGGIPSAEAVTDEARDVNPGQAGFIDLIAGPESEKIGIDVRAAFKTYKGKDEQLYAEFRDARTGDFAFVKPDDLAGKNISFPGQMAQPGKTAVVLSSGKVQTVNKKDVDLEIPSFGHMFGPGVNMIPMPTSLMPTRAFYSAKYWSQFLPMVKGETPLVQSQVPGKDYSFAQYYGRKVGALNSKVSGEVTRVTDKGITIVDENGKKHVTEVAKDFPFNRMTSISYFPTVKAGDEVKVGDMLAHSNFTDKDTGAVNMGVNLRTAVVPYRGFTFEDAYAVSETGASKLATERLYAFDKERRHGTELSRNRFVSAFPKKFTREQVNKIDENGVVKPGTVINKGDPVILALGPKMISSADAQLGRLHKSLRNSFRDDSEVWEHAEPGVVTDVAVTARGAKVNIKSESPSKVGDKITNLSASKGVISKIIPDDEMPRNSVTGEPYEALLNPMAVLTRVAPNQLIELQLAKIAKKTGKPYILPHQAPKEGWVQFAQNELRKHGMEESAPLYDPETGKTTSPVGEGLMYFSAFHHLAEKKLSGRDVGGYTADMQPARGGSLGAKKMSGMDINALLAHGATEVIRDSQLIRGTKNEDFWNSLRSGRPLPEPGVPFVYEKFINLLRAGGMRTQKNGDIMSIMPLTNKDIESVSAGEITNSAMVDSASFEPRKGGLFDLATTGGMRGQKWAHIPLASPMPSPVMEEPIRRLLGLTNKEYMDIVAGTEELNGLTGGEAIRDALGDINIDEEIEKYRSHIKDFRGAKRDNAVKSLRYLSAAKKQDIHPRDWVLDKLPVLPPVFRPVSQMGNLTLISDINELYRDVLETNDTINKLRTDIPESQLAEEKRSLYGSVAAAFGLGEPITPEGRSKGLKGAVKQVIGNRAKHGLFQSKVISKTVDVVGRGVITPDPNLDMDSVGIPAEKAWTLYRPFVIRRLVRRGFTPVRAAELVTDRTAEAREDLEKEMRFRPVLVDRAPTWHKFNLLAFYPHIVDEDVIHVSPLITAGFNADFDGDTMNFHVPVSEKAVIEAKERMMPSKNLFRVTNLRQPQHTPSKEMLMGLYQMTKEPNRKSTKYFPSMAEARAAFKKGLIGLNDPIIIKT
jgi:DNA-directed RNA polymerase beta subunit